MDIISLKSVDSTNNWLKDNEKSLSDPVLVYTEEQTSGRGQRGNTWESEPGKNVTASLFFKPLTIEAQQQFFISEIIALSIVDTLRDLGVDTKIKWPNDIYAGNKKICGILVENSILGQSISHSIAGFGININQEVFLSDAPNPVSVKMITGSIHKIEKVVEILAGHLQDNLRLLQPENRGIIHDRFLMSLWRKDGEEHEFYDPKLQQRFNAKIEDVETEGILILRKMNGEKRKYSFKEVEFIL